MKRPLLLALCLSSLFMFTPANASADQEKPKYSFNVRFQNLKFGESPAEVIKLLPKFKVVEKKPNSVRFSGKVGSEDADIYAIFTPTSHKLWKVSVFFLTPANIDFYSVKSKYNVYKNALVKKYGEPSSDYAFFSDPYYEGDGYETSAIKLGKGTFSSFWMSTDGAISCEIDDDLDIAIRYENDKYSKIDDNEKEVLKGNDL